MHRERERKRLRENGELRNAAKEREFARMAIQDNIFLHFKGIAKLARCFES
jgi:hypothetical protein